MNRRIIGIILLIFLLTNCQKENQPPTCEILTPIIGAKFQRGEKVIVSADARDTDGSIKEVRFFIDGEGKSSSNSFPYKYEWETVEAFPGTHTIKVVAIDDGNLEAEITLEITLEIFQATVLTNEIRDVSNNSAICTGEVISDGGSNVSERGICWSISQNPTISNNKKIAGNGLGSFEALIDELNSNTTYYIRAYAKNEKDISYGENKAFETEKEILFPTVETNSANEINESSAVLIGNVVSDGNSNIIERGFYWSKTDNTPDAGDNKEIVNGQTGTFYKNLIALELNTTYYFRAFATNSKGTAEGVVKQFKTDEHNVFEADDGTFSDIRDGNIYKWIKIGEQVWMAENLKYLPQIDNPQYMSYSLAYYYIYNFRGTNLNDAKSNTDFKTYGALYNWVAAKNACPYGWKLPSDNDWEELAQFVSDNKGPYVNSVEYDMWYDVGKHLKATSSWDRVGTNDFDFNALPGGGLTTPNSFSTTGAGFWWSSTEYSNTIAWGRVLFTTNDLFARFGKVKSAVDIYKNSGFSVRCIKD